MPGEPLFEIHGNIVRELKIVIKTLVHIGSEKWRPLGVTGPPKDEITCIQFHRAP